MAKRSCPENILLNMGYSKIVENVENKIKAVIFTCRLVVYRYSTFIDDISKKMPVVLNCKLHYNNNKSKTCSILLRGENL